MLEIADLTIKRPHIMPLVLNSVNPLDEIMTDFDRIRF